MKTTILIFSILFSTYLFAQSKFTIGFGINEQFVKKDTGINYEGFVGYNISQNIAINFVGSNSEMTSKELNFKYRLDKYSILMSYDFGKSEKSKFESLFGFSYVNFDKELLSTNNDGIGIDIGIQTSFGL
jgi:hypothetical protein